MQSPTCHPEVPIPSDRPHLSICGLTSDVNKVLAPNRRYLWPRVAVVQLCVGAEKRCTDYLEVMALPLDIRSQVDLIPPPCCGTAACEVLPLSSRPCAVVLAYYTRRNHSHFECDEAISAMTFEFHMSSVTSMLNNVLNNISMPQMCIESHG